ncbi:MAG: TetR/AcrR family transcriptional regulator [Actinoplanes sp.]
MPKRAYRSVARAESARATRAGVLRAAEELFAEHGYVQTTVAGIAERAQVAMNTVYTSVGGKPALIDALVQDSTGDAAIDASLAGILAETDGRRILRIVAEGAGEVTRRHSTVLRILVDNASADPAVAAAAGFAERRYRERLAIVAGHLVALGAVATDAARTEQILWFYFGFPAWATLRALGWDWPDVATWLADQAASALLHRHPPP